MGKDNKKKDTRELIEAGYNPPPKDESRPPEPSPPPPSPKRERQKEKE